ncbi:RecA-family ATPase (fragment) [Mesorhizobium sp. ORS 3359]
MKQEEYGSYQQPDAKPADALTSFAAHVLAERPVPPREWHVEEFVPARTVTMLNGDGGTGKSLLALQLAVATTQGGYWAGRPVKSGRVVYFSAEDDIDELHRRLADITASCNITIADLIDLTIAPMAGKDALLAMSDGKTNVLKTTRVFAGLDGLLRSAEPALYIIDTLADVFGGEENQRAQARQFVGMLRGLCITHDTTGLVLAHPSLSGMASGSGSSGSTAWNNSVRSRLYLERLKGEDDDGVDPDLRVLRTVKANYGPLGQEIRLRWKAGAFMPEGSGDSFAQMAAHSKAERIFLEILTAYEADGRYVSATPSANYAPTVFAKDPRADGVRKFGFTDAMNRLFEAKKIVTMSYGPPSKGSKRIARA